MEFQSHKLFDFFKNLLTFIIRLDQNLAFVWNFVPVQKVSAAKIPITTEPSNAVITGFFRANL